LYDDPRTSVTLRRPSYNARLKERTMDEPRRPAGTDPAKVLQARRRARRGVVASYIHELSERHSGGDSRVPKDAPGRPEDAPA
jgi:hypothetical protein